MGLTITKDPAMQTNYSLESALARGLKMEIGKFTPDNSWLAAGEAMSFGFTPVVVFIEPKSGYVFEYDYTNSKELAYYADYDAVADGALIAVVDTTDLSTACADTYYIAFGWN